MNLAINDLQILSEVAIQAATSAATLIRSYTNQKVDIQRKEMGTQLASQVVTEVDFKSQEIILEHLTPTRQTYDLGLLSEEIEDDMSRFEKDFFWCIDPLDGTLQFTQSEPGYSVSIALVSRKGVPMIGVVCDPRNGTLYHAIRGMGAFKDHQRWEPGTRKNRTTTKVVLGAAVISACQVIEKQPAYFLKLPKIEEGGGCLWDYAATACLFQELNCWVSDAYGQPLQLNNQKSLYMNRLGILYASNASLANDHILQQRE